MRWLLPMVCLVSCNTSQPGCTQENCRLMVEACRVEFGSFSTICLTTNRIAPGTDFSPWCVQACNARAGNGQLAQCIAGKADECRGARDAGKTFDQVIDPCLDKTAVGPEKGCDDQCAADRNACDDKCTGGKPCDACFRAGMTDCSAVCPDAGFVACADCSTSCSLAYTACSDRCPRL